LEHDLDEELRHDAQQYFDENILSVNGKKSFINWLFKMVRLLTFNLAPRPHLALTTPFCLFSLGGY